MIRSEKAQSRTGDLIGEDDEHYLVQRPERRAGEHGSGHGAGDLLELRIPGAKDTELIPFTDAFVPEVDIAAHKVTDAKLQQALDSAGTSAKDITGKALTQIVKATGDNKQALINVKPEELDTVNGFGFVRLSITVGTAASLAGAQILGVNPRYASADALNQAAVAQIV